MSKQRFALLARWRLVVGIMLIGLGLAWQPLSSLAFFDDDFGGFTVRPEFSDQVLFGKKLVSYRTNPALDQYGSELKPAGGPVVPLRLRIPALDIDSRVETVGVRNGRMDVPTNIWDAGWLKTSVRPGDAGNALIAAHKDSVNGVALFYNLTALKAGDKIYVSDRGGSEVTFEVYETASYALDAAPLDRIFGPSSDNNLVLLTCDGDFVPEQHSYDKRLVVYARMVK